MSYKSFVYQSSIIFYQVIGKGKPVLLIHGFGEDSTIWENQVNFLKHNYTLIIPDLPGSGKSQLISDMSIEGMSEVIKEIIDIEVLKLNSKNQVTLLGHSMGGYITLALIEKYSTLFSSFGLIHSSAFTDDEEKKAARKKSIEFIKTNGAYEFLKTSIPNLFYKSKEGHNPTVAYMNILIEKGKKFSAEALIAYYNAMINRVDKTNVLKTFCNPILFIIGEHDLAISFKQSMQQCHLPQQTHVIILRNTAHMGMWEETEKTNNTLSTFLSIA